ncbi:MAG: ferritin [Candidatus Hinthialibacter sp.]
MINPKLQEALNKQINAELYSSYLYFAMSAYFEDKSLKGMAHWMKMQAQEEMVHALKFCDFLNDRGGRVLLEAIDKPPVEWNSPLHAFEEAYKHEQKVTALINDLVDLAISIKDHAANSFLQWFVDEQVEEEASADEIVQNLKLVEEHPHGIFMLNKDLSSRSTPSLTDAD